MFRELFNSYIKRRLFLSGKKQKRIVHVLSISQAKTVGIIWNPSDNESIETYELLRKTLSDRGIKSFGIAYVNSKREKETLATVSNSWLISSDDVSFKGKPHSGVGINFIHEKFDFLIDLSITKNIVLQYILIYSVANLKTGWRGNDPNLYDLEIDVASNPNCRYLMEQILFYLEKLNENK